MFAPDIVGAANGFVGGWGNLGGGVTQLVVGTGLLLSIVLSKRIDVILQAHLHPDLHPLHNSSQYFV